MNRRPWLSSAAKNQQQYFSAIFLFSICCRRVVHITGMLFLVGLHPALALNMHSAYHVCFTTDTEI